MHSCTQLRCQNKEESKTCFFTTPSWKHFICFARLRTEGVNLQDFQVWNRTRRGPPHSWVRSAFGKAVYEKHAQVGHTRMSLSGVAVAMPAAGYLPPKCVFSFLPFWRYKSMVLASWAGSPAMSQPHGGEAQRQLAMCRRGQRELPGLWQPLPTMLVTKINPIQRWGTLGTASERFCHLHTTRGHKKATCPALPWAGHSHWPN